MHFVFPAKFCINYCFQIHLRIDDNSLCKILWGKPNALWVIWKSLIEHRVIFKLLLFTCKALHGLAPDYLANLLTFYNPVRTLRFSRSINLFVLRSRTFTYGDRSFACVSPRLWNKLPDFIRYSETLDSFKTMLKTHLFKIDFNL